MHRSPSWAARALTSGVTPGQIVKHKRYLSRANRGAQGLQIVRLYEEACAVLLPSLLNGTDSVQPKRELHGGQDLQEIHWELSAMSALGLRPAPGMDGQE